MLFIFLHQYDTAGTWQWLPKLPEHMFLLQRRVNGVWIHCSVLIVYYEVGLPFPQLWRPSIADYLGQQEWWWNSGLYWNVCSWDKHHVLMYGFRVHCLKPQVCVEQQVQGGCSHALRGDTFPLGNQCLCPMFACEQGCWQGLCVRLLIRLFWGKLNHLESTGCFVSCWNVFAGSGASSHAVLTGFFLLVLSETKLIYKICWTGLFKLFYHWKYVFSLHVLFLGKKKKKVFLKISL